MADAATAVDLLEAAHDSLATSTLYAKWRAANPGEATAYDTYRQTGWPVPAPRTPFGKHVVRDAQALHWLTFPMPYPLGGI